MLWSLLCVATDVNVSEVTHIAGEDNEKCDRLSRRGKTARAFVAKGASDMGLGAVSVISFETDETVMEILRLCDRDRLNTVLVTSPSCDTRLHNATR